MLVVTASARGRWTYVERLSRLLGFVEEKQGLLLPGWGLRSASANRHDAGQKD